MGCTYQFQTDWLLKVYSVYVVNPAPNLSVNQLLICIRLPVKTSKPIATSKAPLAAVSCGIKRRTRPIAFLPAALFMATAIKMKGTPKPSAYTTSSAKPRPTVEAWLAIARMDASTGPIQGVQPTPNAPPMIIEPIGPAERPRAWDRSARASRISQGMRMIFNKCNPKIMITRPAIRSIRVW